MHPILNCVRYFKNEVLQSPIKIKVIGAASWQVSRRPWQTLPHKIIGTPASLISIRVKDLASASGELTQRALRSYREEIKVGSRGQWEIKGVGYLKSGL